MKKSIGTFRTLSLVNLSAALFALLAGTAQGQLFVANYGNGTIGEYTTSGATVNASLISGITSPPFSIAISGTNMFFDYDNSVAEYSTSGKLINGSLLSGIPGVEGLAVSGNNLFVGNYTTGTIGEYTLDGTPVNTSLITGLSNPAGIAISGGNLFVANYGNGTIGEYTTSGATVNASLISGITSPPFFVALSGTNLFFDYDNSVAKYSTSGKLINGSLLSGIAGVEGLAVSGNDLFVGNYTTGTIGEYTLDGTPVDTSLITGLSNPAGIAIVETPEPSCTMLAALGSCLLLGCFYKKRHG